MSHAAYAIEPAEVQTIEDLVAHVRAFRCVATPVEPEEHEALDDVDEAADRVAAICRRVRRQGS